MITDILIVVNIILLEVLLSVDNAAVLATMVKTLKPKDQKRALTYGIIGAYVFRGLALISASILVKFLWLKIIGGLYLIYLAYKSLASKSEGGNPKPISIAFLSPFWSTVVAIELADLVFSIDNVFAAVAFTDNLWLICGGVFVGIIAMRFAANGFVKLIEKYPILEKVAYWVVGLLGVKLIASYWLKDLNTEFIDLGFSALVLSAFIIPILMGRNEKAR
jgi:YkoY family integral membrane protein